MPSIFSKQIVGSSDVSFVGTPSTSVPFTQITNRALINDLANDVAPKAVDRVMTLQAIEILNELGSNGERVWGALNDDRNLIRFVGEWSLTVPTYGQCIKTASVNDYVEVAFYGTGLNVLLAYATSIDVRSTIDGGSESANIVASQSDILGGRNYSPNRVIPVTSGLSLGLHCVKLRLASGQFDVSGFEILNECTDLRINPGSLIKDQRKAYLASTFTQAFKPSALSGTKGGRVVVYSQGNSIGTAVNAVNISQLNLTAADHSNEDIIRSYSHFEFGAGRADDFSKQQSGNPAMGFTLDDGLTTLTTSASTGVQGFVTAAGFGLSLNNSSGSFWTFTFIGTGLDLLLVTDGSTRTFDQILIDGTNIGSVSKTANTAPEIRKIVSGLPYGTHTVKALVNAGSFIAPGVTRWIVYGPKKPTLPAGVVEIADYNVMADFVANTVAGQDTIATGVLRKMSTRENNYVGGSWTFNNGGALDITNFYISGGFEALTNGSGNYYEYTFFGTGFEQRFRADTNRSSNISVTLNGLAATAANFPTMVTSVYGTGVSFSSGTLDQNDAATSNGAGFRLSNLPLAKYTVRFTTNAAAFLAVDTMDIITPIHVAKSNLLADLQNTLPIGNCSLQDSRQLVLSNKSGSKAWSQALGITTNPTTTSGSFVPVPDLSLTLKTSGNSVEIQMGMSISNTSNNANIAIFVDGVMVGLAAGLGASSVATPISTSVIVPLSAGTHKIDGYWLAEGGGTITSYATGAPVGANRFIKAREL